MYRESFLNGTQKTYFVAGKRKKERKKTRKNLAKQTKRFRKEKTCIYR